MKQIKDEVGIFWNVFRFGCKYQMEPFEEAPDYKTVIPLKQADGKNFDFCMVVDNKGKPLTRVLGGSYYKGIMVINADLCFNESKLPSSNIPIIQKISKKWAVEIKEFLKTKTEEET